MIFIVRHGQTDFNKNHLMQGAGTDISLNQNGILQAKERQKAFDGVQFEAVVSSPLKRAIQTAEILTENSKVDNFIIDKRFIERDYGPFEGKPVEGSSFSYYFGKIPGAEEPEHLSSRVVEGIKEISKKYSGNVLISTHGIATGSFIFGQTGDDSFHLDAASCTVVDPDGCKLIGYNLSNEEIQKYIN